MTRQTRWLHTELYLNILIQQLQNMNQLKSGKHIQDRH